MKYKYPRNAITISIFLFLSVITGCAVALIGGGVAIGAFAYHHGKLIRTYKSEYHETIIASRESLKDLKIPITEEIGDELNTIIRAKRPNGTPITIEVEKIERNLTEVSVRSGAVGVWDKNVSKEIHDLIDDKLVRLAKKNSKYTPQPNQEDSKTVKDESLQQGVAAAEYDENLQHQSVQKESSPEVNYKSGVQSHREKANIVIYFSHNSTEISDEEAEKLDQVAKALIANPNSKFLASGFSDSTGSPAYNKLISESRASMVKVYLVGKGAKPSQFTIEGRGAESFIGSNDTEDGRKLNRRVELRKIRP
jgi:outer membrane protein OmpA-like peptidoglycan-associated protein